VGCGTESSDRFGLDVKPLVRINPTVSAEYLWDVRGVFLVSTANFSLALAINLDSNSTYAQNMRLAQILLLTCAVGSASTLTNTYFGASDPYVIGIAANFDTQSISVSFNSSTHVVTAVIDLDYDNGGATINPAVTVPPGTNQDLAPFSYLNGAITLGTGDLFFYDPSAPTTSLPGTQGCPNNGTVPCVTEPNSSALLDAVVLDGGNGFTTGALYAIDGTIITTQDASQALGLPPTSDTYRPYQAVGLMYTPKTGSPTAATDGTESVCKIGTAPCPTGSEQYQITLNFTPPTGALLSLLEEGKIGVEFAAADCGNAVTAGNVWVTTTPEPGTLGMIAAGIGLLGFGLARRRRKN
jgi:hypothetical protein